MSFWDDFTPGTTFMSAEQKKSLVDTGEIFLIVGVRDMESKFGPTWLFDVEVEGFDEPITISLSHNVMRDTFAQAMKNHLANGGAPVPSMLTAVRARNGQDAYNFQSPFDEETSGPRESAYANDDDLAKIERAQEIINQRRTQNTATMTQPLTDDDVRQLEESQGIGELPF